MGLKSCGMPTHFWKHLKSTPDLWGVLGAQTVVGVGPLNRHQFSYHRHKGLLHLWYGLATGRQMGRALSLGLVCPKSLSHVSLYLSEKLPGSSSW